VHRHEHRPLVPCCRHTDRVRCCGNKRTKTPIRGERAGEAERGGDGSPFARLTTRLLSDMEMTRECRWDRGGPSSFPEPYNRRMGIHYCATERKSMLYCMAACHQEEGLPSGCLSQFASVLSELSLAWGRRKPRTVSHGADVPSTPSLALYCKTPVTNNPNVGKAVFRNLAAPPAPTCVVGPLPASNTSLARIRALIGQLGR